MLQSKYWCFNMCQRRTVFMILGLIVGCVAKVSVSSVLIFSLYQGTLKDTFNYTQTQVELINSMLYVGSCLGFAPGMFYDRYGPEWTAETGLVITVGAYLLIWSSTRSIEFYSNNAWIMALYFCMGGIGGVFTYVTSMTTNLINFDNKHAGKIVGLLNTCYYLGGFFFAFIFYSYFTLEEAIIKSIKYDFPGFMLFVAILSAGVHILCIFFLRTYESNPENDKQSNNINSESELHDMTVSDTESAIGRASSGITDTGSDSKTTKNTNNVNETRPLVDKPDSTNYTENNTASDEEKQCLNTGSSVPLSLMELLMNLDYHLAAWSFAITMASSYFYMANVTIFTESVNLDEYNSTLISSFYIATAVNCAFSGYISDVLKEKMNVPRTVEVIVGIMCILLTQLLVVYLAEYLIVMEIVSAIHGFGYGAISTIGLLVVNDMFYKANLGRNIGIMYVLIGVVVLGLQLVFGALYDAQVRSAGGAHCYGAHCFRDGLVISIFLLSLALALSFVLHVKKRHVATA